MRRVSYLLLSASLISGCAGVATNESLSVLLEKSAASSPKLTSYQKGKQYLQLRQYGLAVAAFQEELQGSPDSIQALNGLAIAYDRLGRQDVSQKLLDRALKVDPRSAVTLNNLAYLNLTQGNTEVALAYSERAKVAIGAVSDMPLPPTIAEAVARNDMIAKDVAANDADAMLSEIIDNLPTEASNVRRVGLNEWELRIPSFQPEKGSETVHKNGAARPQVIKPTLVSPVAENESRAIQDASLERTADVTMAGTAEATPAASEADATSESAEMSSAEIGSANGSMDRSTEAQPAPAPDSGALAPAASVSHLAPAASKLNEPTPQLVSPAVIASASQPGTALSLSTPSLDALPGEPATTLRGRENLAAPSGEPAPRPQASAGPSASDFNEAKPTVPFAEMARAPITMAPADAVVAKPQMALSGVARPLAVDPTAIPVKVPSDLSMLTKPDLSVPLTTPSDAEIALLTNAPNGTSQPQILAPAVPAATVPSSPALSLRAPVISVPTVVPAPAVVASNNLQLASALPLTSPPEVANEDRKRASQNDEQVATAAPPPPAAPPAIRTGGEWSLQVPYGTKVRVSNGTGRRLMATRFSHYLGEHGLSVRRIANAASFNYTVSIIFYNPDQKDFACALASKLSFPVKLMEAKQGKGWIEVVLGSDLLSFDSKLRVSGAL